MNFRITTLVENTVPIGGGKKLIGEHGLSFYIEDGDKSVLFDTGQGMALLNNARVLGIDLTQVDTVVLSHGHYDHSGGLPGLLELTTDFTLIAHPDAFRQKFKEDKGKYKSIGMPVEQKVLKDKGVLLRLEKKPVNLSRDITTSGEIPLESDFEKVASGFYTQKENERIRDTLPDDLALILNTAKGLVVILGCSHRGVINTLHQVRKVIGEKYIHAVMGGLHLVKASDQTLRKVVEHLRGFELEKIIVGHCTGMKAILALFNEFKDRVHLNTVAHVVEF